MPWRGHGVALLVKGFDVGNDGYRRHDKHEDDQVYRGHTTCCGACFLVAAWKSELMHIAATIDMQRMTQWIGLVRNAFIWRPFQCCEALLVVRIRHQPSICRVTRRKHERLTCRWYHAER